MIARRLTTAANPTKAATMANATSSWLTACLSFLTTGALVPSFAAAGLAIATPAEAGGLGGGGGAPTGRAGTDITAGPAAAGAVVATGAAGAAAPTADPPAGMDGSLIVGDALGLGGNAIRTVSFFGCTFAASGGLGGTGAAGGTIGLFSAIRLSRGMNSKGLRRKSQLLFQAEPRRKRIWLL